RDMSYLGLLGFPGPVRTLVTLGSLNQTQSIQSLSQPNGGSPLAAYLNPLVPNTAGAIKASIVLFDYVPGSGKTFTVPMGVSKIRAFVVGGGGTAAGGGGGYSEKILNVSPGQQFSYTVGSNSGTSSF